MEEAKGSSSSPTWTAERESDEHERKHGECTKMTSAALEKNTKRSDDKSSQNSKSDGAKSEGNLQIGAGRFGSRPKTFSKPPKQQAAQDSEPTANEARLELLEAASIISDCAYKYAVAAEEHEFSELKLLFSQISVLANRCKQVASRTSQEILEHDAKIKQLPAEITYRFAEADGSDSTFKVNFLDEDHEANAEAKREEARKSSEPYTLWRERARPPQSSAAAAKSGEQKSE